jgi:hypothetical protein
MWPPLAPVVGSACSGPVAAAAQVPVVGCIPGGGGGVGGSGERGSCGRR